MSEDEIRKIFSKNLTTQLSRHGRNQKDLVDFIKVSSSTVSNWCTGQKLPRMDKIQMIAEWLGIKSSDLLEKKQHTSKDEINDLDLRKIERARNKMTDKDKVRMMKILAASFEDYFNDDFEDNDTDE